MDKIAELEEFVNRLVEPVKIARADLDSLSLHELETLVGLDLSQDDEKVAYLSNCVKEAYGEDRYGSWLEQFEGSPLKAKALQLCEQELTLEQERLQRRIERDATMKDDSDTWTQQDMLRLQKDVLMLELHKAKTGQGGGKDPTMQPQAQEAAIEEPAAPPSGPPKAGKTAPPKAGKTAADDQPGLLESGAMHAQIAREHKGLQGSVGALTGGISGGLLGRAASEPAREREAVKEMRTANKANQRRLRKGEFVTHSRVEKLREIAGKNAPLKKKIVGALKKHGPVAAGTALGAGALGALGVATAGAERKARERREKKASDVQTVGQINNGDPNPPEWPRATLGVDAAGRRATPEEEREQTKVVTPDIAHVQPKTSGAATQLGERVLGKALSSGTIDNSLIRKGLNAAQHVGSRLGGKTTESAVGRGLLAAGGATAATGAAGAALATRDKKSALVAAVEAAHGLPFGGKLASALGTLAMDVGSQAKHMTRLSTFAKRTGMASHETINAANTALKNFTPKMPMAKPRVAGPVAATVASKKTPTQAIDRLALPKHLAKTNPQHAIQAGRQFGAPVVGSSSVLDQLSRTSFDKLSRAATA
jgi:hypothetical protein